MGVITNTTTLAANTTSANLIAGQINEFLARPSVVSLFITADNPGLLATLLVGKDVVIDRQEVSDANRFPQTPEDFLDRGAGLGGERITLRLDNPTAGVIIGQWRLAIESVA